MIRRIPLVLLAVLLLPQSAGAYAFLSNWGCEEGKAAIWLQQPSPWHLSVGGYSRMPREAVEKVFIDSAAAWGKPCCSSFRAEYLGATTEGYYGPGNNIAFEESSWPQEFGHQYSTIAVTLNRYRGCSIEGSGMAFNGRGFRFDTGGRATDLQAVATHEFGHWIGLAHTNVPGSTMLPFYSGQEGRTPGHDDEAGACFLYRQACTCTEDADCESHERCVDEACAALACTGNADCPEGAACIDGACEPGCRVHADCGASGWCEEGVCRERFDRCDVCKPCTSHSDCGSLAHGYRCLSLGEQSVCTRQCGTDADCPGTSVCQPGWQLCGSPDSPWTLCKNGFTCEVETHGCSHLGETCSGPDGCGGSSDTCVDLDGRKACSCTCTADSDCGEGGVCLSDPVTKDRACFPKEELEACGHFYCHPSESCIKGELRCGRDPCSGITCGEGETCRLGACVDPCQDVTCKEGFVCEDGSCAEAPKAAAAPPKTPKKSTCSASGSGMVSLPLLLLFGHLLLRGRRGSVGTLDRFDPRA